MQDLQKLLSYRNPDIIARYQKDFPDNTMSADEALSELLTFFWLTNEHKHDTNQFPHKADLQFTCVIHEEMLEIDDMWHTFLLFTEDYQKFCCDNFGAFIHHFPVTEKAKATNNDDYELELERYLSYIYDKLGAQTLKIWFKEAVLD